MKIYEVILIGIVLSIDACAITIANCATYKGRLSTKKEWSMPVAFALFQGVMPLIGFFVGYLFLDYIASATKFITAGIFFLLAGKIVFDVVKEKICERKIVEVDRSACKVKKPFSIGVLLLQAVATSIDALAVGVTLIDLTFSVFFAVLIISAVTFVFVSCSLFFGKRLGKLFGKYAEWVGAVILLALAIKSLIEGLI
ncbi:MAG: manganese efflux pump [Clostridia bacterium]|nr:manganese efflux pump [Clostridia bacterium]